MKILQSNSQFRIFGDDLTILDTIPPGTYNINFNPMTGYSLILRNDLELLPRIYGDHEPLAAKMINRYLSMNRNFGAILSGRKGTGKSLTARVVSNKLLEAGIPTILVTENTPGIVDFLSSIEQQVFVLFDEFEKVFPYDKTDSSIDEQRQFLSLFDGLVNNRHFYMATVNDRKKLNPYFIGRTGRFYYDIKFDSITHKEVSEFINDNLEVEMDTPHLINLLTRLNASYDQMTAIVTELNFGESLEDVFTYLNLDIGYDIDQAFMAKITLDNGDILETVVDVIAITGEIYKNVNLTIDTDNGSRSYDFQMKADCAFDEQTGKPKVVTAVVTHNYNNGRGDDSNWSYPQNFKIVSIKLQDIIEPTLAQTLAQTVAYQIKNNP